MFALTIFATTIPIHYTENCVESCQMKVRATKIEIKEKVVNGVRYVRRWDATNNKWLDPDWRRVD